jgi:hypothetical protein
MIKFGFYSHQHLQPMFQLNFGQLKNLRSLKVHHQHQNDLINTNIIIIIVISITIIVIIVDDIALKVQNQLEIDNIKHYFLQQK